MRYLFVLCLLSPLAGAQDYDAAAAAQARTNQENAWIGPLSAFVASQPQPQAQQQPKTTTCVTRPHRNVYNQIEQVTTCD